MKQTVNPANHYKLNNNWLLTDCVGPLWSKTLNRARHIINSLLILLFDLVMKQCVLYVLWYYFVTDLDEFEKYDVRLFINLF